MTFGHPMMRSIVAIRWVFGDISRAHNAVPFKRRSEHSCIAWHGKLSEPFAIDTGQRVQQITLSSFVDYVVEKRSELSSAKLQPRIGCRLHQNVQIEILCKQQASLNDKFEIPLYPARLLPLVNHLSFQMPE